MSASRLFTILLLTLTVTAVPVHRSTNFNLTSSGSGSTAAQNSVPLTSTLPSPVGTLQYIGLGLGTQNYTCASAGATAVSVGAVATLYDVTSVLKPAINRALIPTVPALAYSTGNIGTGQLDVLGHHFFSAAGSPTFVLNNAKLTAKKSADVLAPSTAPANSVDWLYLVDNGAGLSNGLSSVYRVETDNGQPGPCTQAGNVQVKYAAEYWFYN